MILLIENRFEEFAPVFWRYVRAGGYRCGWRNSDVPHFYRFTEPRDSNYPKMIELFSRRPDFQLEQPEIHLTPLPVSEDISSLSAIMLNDDYYDLMLSLCAGNPLIKEKMAGCGVSDRLQGKGMA